MKERFKNERGEVAVLYSPRYGAGWSSWLGENKEDAIFNPILCQIVAKIEAEREKDLPDEEVIADLYLQLEGKAEELFPGEYLGGLRDIAIEWMQEGQVFKIEEYDGCESIEYLSNLELYRA